MILARIAWLCACCAFRNWCDWLPVPAGGVIVMVGATTTFFCDGWRNHYKRFRPAGGAGRAGLIRAGPPLDDQGVARAGAV
jgi:hypothetical protein